MEYEFSEQGELREMGEKRKRPIPAISIVHVEGDLFFGAAELFRTQIQRTVSDPAIQVIILRLKNARHLDATSVMALEDLIRFMREKGLHLIVSGASREVYRVLKQSGVLLTLQEGQGGEVFVPKIPACTVKTLADAVAPEAEQHIIGIRPGEKIHELMITADESRNVLEYERHFVITPSFPWWGGPKREGKRVRDGFWFSSDIAQQLDAVTVRAMLRELGYPV